MLEDGGLEMIRTSDLRFRKPPLYPAELRDQILKHQRRNYNYELPFYSKHKNNQEFLNIRHLKN